MVAIDSDLATYVSSVAYAADWLLRRLDTPGAVQAAALLAERAGQAPGAPAGEPGPDDIGQVMARLAVTDTLLAADRAVDSAARAEDREAFRGSVARITATARELEAEVRVPVSGFAPAIAASPDSATAATRLRQHADNVLEAVVNQMTGTVKDISGRLIGPYEQVTKDALAAVGSPIDMGEWRGELASTARRLIDWVLDRLARVLPARLLEGARDRARQLLTACDLRSAVAVALGITDTSATITACLARPGLDRARLDDGTAKLIALVKQYDVHMGWARRSLALTGLLAVAAPVVPHAALVAPVLFLTVLCATVLISMAYVDSGHGLGFIHGVRYVVTDSCGVRP